MSKADKFTRAAVTLLSFSIFTTGGAMQQRDIQVSIDGEVLEMRDVQPVIINNRVMIPIRGVFERMNAKVQWNIISQTVIANQGTHNIRLPINSYLATIDGRSVRLDSPAVIFDGRTLVPLRFISEAIGAGVKWDARAREVKIMSKPDRWQADQMVLGVSK